MQSFGSPFRLGLAILSLALLVVLLVPAPVRGQSITGEQVECTDGTAAGYPCSNVDLWAYLSRSDLGGSGATSMTDVWGWTDPQTGTEYVFAGRTDGTAIVDVSTPTDPVFVGELPTRTQSSTWRDMKVYDNHLYVVSEAPGHGMQVLDLTQLRSVGADERPVTFSATAHYDEVSAAHNVAINTDTGFAYILGGDEGGTTCGGGLHMVDLSTPAAPTFAGCFADPSTGRAGTGYTHDAQCVLYEGPDADYQGREVCFNANETALNVADVTDKDNPSTIVNAQYPQIGYVHQAWLTEDQRYLYVDDELDEAQGFVEKTRTMVFDVTDLDNPTLVTSYAGATSAIDHNQYIVGPYSYQANYTSGLRLLDVADPEQPQEVAYFDTYPRNNDASFSGAWSVYPFFDRNVIAVTSIDEGLFLLQPHPPPILSLSASPQAQGARVQWSISATAQTDRIVVEHRPPTATTWTEAGTLRGQSGDGVQSYEFSFEDLTFGTHQVRVRHESVSGTSHTSAPVDVKILPTDAYVARGPSPHPVRTQSSFKIILKESQPLTVALYDVLGRRVEVLHDGPVPEGVLRRFRIRARQRSSGTYFLRVTGPSVQLTRKVVITR